MTQTPHTKADRGGQRPPKADSDEPRRAKDEHRDEPPTPGARARPQDTKDAAPAVRPAEPSPANASAQPGKDERRNRSI